MKESRQRIFSNYSQILGSLPKIQLPTQREYVDPIWHLFPLRVPTEQRKRIYLDFREAGIGVQVNYFPVHLQPVFQNKGLTRGAFPIAENFYSKEISLPIWPGLEVLGKDFYKSILQVLIKYN